MKIAESQIELNNVDSLDKIREIEKNIKKNNKQLGGLFKTAIKSQKKQENQE